MFHLAHHPYRFHEDIYLEEISQRMPLAVPVTRNVSFIGKNVAFRSMKQIEKDFSQGTVAIPTWWIWVPEVEPQAFGIPIQPPACRK